MKPDKSLNELVQHHYHVEADRAAQFSSRLSLPVGIITILLGALVVMAKDVHLPLSWHSRVQLAILLASAIASGYAGAQIFRSLLGFESKYVASLLEVLKFKDDLIQSLISEGKASDEAQVAAEKDSVAYVYQRYAECADVNLRNTDRKSKLIYLAFRGLLIAILCAACAGFINVYDAIVEQPRAQLIEVSNLKEHGPMTTDTQQPQPNVPSNPAQPQPIPRPTPPPDRVIKEDHPRKR